MDGPAFAVVFGVIPTFFTLVVSILFYRLAYRKKTRSRANLYSWLITIGIGVVTEIILFVVFEEDLGLQVISSYFYVPLIGIGIPSVWALIRLITIKATPKKERNVVRKTQEPKLE